MNLSEHTAGIATFRNGDERWAVVSYPGHGADFYNVRYEHERYGVHAEDGSVLFSGLIVHEDGTEEDIVDSGMDIIGFIDDPSSDK